MSESAPTQAPEAPARAPADAAVQRHLQRLRPWRIAYGVGVLVVVAALLVIVKVAYSVGEISHVTLRTAASVPKAVPLGTPSATLTRAWTSTDRTALGFPYRNGTVITWDDHAMRGRDARTGAITWSYTRTDRILCAALQTNGVAVAVYEVNGNCDEVTGLDAETGERRWTRTLDKDSNRTDHALDGHPRYAVASSTVLIWTPQVAYAIDPSGSQYSGNKQGGLDRWVFAHTGCAIGDIVLGGEYGLISQTCSGQDCADTRFCGNGPQLLLRDAYAGEDNDSDTNKKNPDQLKWNRIGSRLVPTSAGAVITARSPDGTELDVLAAPNGQLVQRLALSGGSGAVGSVATTNADLIRFGGITYAVRVGNSSFEWQAETDGLPTVQSSQDTGTPLLSDAVITVPTAKGIAQLDPADGTPAATYAAPAPPDGSQVYPYGTGFLVAGPATTMYR